MKDQQDQEPLSLVQLRHLVAEIADGTARPEEAKRLLADFCGHVDSGAVSAADPVVVELLGFLRDRIRSFLAGRETLDGAFGLARKRGRPRTEEQKENDLTIAAEVLRLRMLGDTLEVAAEKIANAEREAWLPKARGETQIRKAWGAYKDQALVLLRIERADEGKEWTPEELVRLTEIYGERWREFLQLGVRRVNENEVARTLYEMFCKDKMSFKEFVSPGSGDARRHRTQPSSPAKARGRRKGQPRAGN